MTPSGIPASSRPKPASKDSIASHWAVDHYLRILYHRKWLITGVFVFVSAVTAIVAWRLPNVYLSETVILVDPQKVPDSYVKSTVTGEVRNRLGTLSQQILSATRLQKIIDTFNLYPDERKTMAREDVITKMRTNISVSIVSDFGSSQDLQAFKIGYRGRDPRVVAQVTNQLASLFIEENLKAREQQATGTTDFLENQLQEARKNLETQELKLKEFKLQHIGEMPEQQSATIQILGQLQSQLQQVSDALARAEQQKSYLQTLMAGQGAAPAVDLDDNEPKATKTPTPGPVAGQNVAAPARNPRAELAALLARYSEKHPSVIRLRRQIEADEAKAKAANPGAAKEVAEVAADPAPAPAVAPAKKSPVVPARSTNPVLQSQLRSVEAEITKNREEQQRLQKQVGGYRGKLEAIPLREQQISEVQRDYEISRKNYASLLEKSLSAQSATQLEIRQKGERFSILDPAQAAERPESPKRALIDAGGAIGGLVLGVIMALLTELLGLTITSAEQAAAASGLPVLEVIPVIQTIADRRIKRKRLVWAGASGAAAALVITGILLYHYRTQLF